MKISDKKNNSNYATGKFKNSVKPSLNMKKKNNSEQIQETLPSSCSKMSPPPVRKKKISPPKTCSLKPESPNLNPKLPKAVTSPNRSRL